MVSAVSLLAIPLGAQAAPAVASHPTVAVPAVAAGKLAPQGCTANGTTPTCDLYAMVGTTSMLGGAPIDIWGFSTTGAAGTATAPGPLLVVNQGDTVTVTLHNQLAGQDVSLAFPGQPTTAFSAGLSAQAEESGVATGATSTYTFTAQHGGHLHLRGRPHRQRHPAGRHGPGRCPRGALLRRVGLWPACDRLPRHGLRR